MTTELVYVGTMWYQTGVTFWPTLYISYISYIISVFVTTAEQKRLCFRVSLFVL